MELFLFILLLSFKVFICASTCEDCTCVESGTTPKQLGINETYLIDLTDVQMCSSGEYFFHLPQMPVTGNSGPGDPHDIHFYGVTEVQIQNAVFGCQTLRRMRMSELPNSTYYVDSTTTCSADENKKWDLKACETNTGAYDWCFVPPKSSVDLQNNLYYGAPDRQYALLLETVDPFVKNHTKVNQPCTEINHNLNYLFCDPVFTSAKLYKQKGFNQFELEVTIPNLSVPEFETKSQDLAAQICTALGREITNCHVISDTQNSDGSITFDVVIDALSTSDTVLLEKIASSEAFSTALSSAVNSTFSRGSVEYDISSALDNATYDEDQIYSKTWYIIILISMAILAFIGLTSCFYFRNQYLDLQKQSNEQRTHVGYKVMNDVF